MLSNFIFRKAVPVTLHNISKTHIQISKKTHEDPINVDHENPVSLPRCSFSQRGTFLKSQCKNHSRNSFLERLNAKSWNASTKRLPKGIWLPRTMFIDFQHKLFICLVLKAGSTTYNSLMVQYSDKHIAKNSSRSALALYHNGVRRPEKFGIKQAGKVSPHELKEALVNYTKVIATRHPFTRLYSFYKDKVLCKASPIFYQADIIKHARNITVASPKDACKMNITFLEFFKWYRPRAHRFGNLHVQRVSHSCKPCEIKYDTFLRIETANDDQLDLINTIFVPNTKRKINAKTIAANVKNRQVSDGVSKQILKQYEGFSDNDIKWMNKYYKQDLELFGYSVNKTGNDSTGKCEIENSHCC